MILSSRCKSSSPLNKYGYLQKLNVIDKKSVILINYVSAFFIDVNNTDFGYVIHIFPNTMFHEDTLDTSTITKII